MGIKGLSKIQLGQEGTPGTAVAADTIWRGPFVGLQDDRVTEKVEEDIGVVLKSSRSYTSQLGALLSMPSQVLSPEQVLHILEAGIKQVNTGSADGAGSSGYTYSYPFGSTAVNTISTYTIEAGDDSQAYEAEYCFVPSLSISGVRGQALMVSAEWMGRQLSKASFTGALSAPSVSELHASTGTLYIDDAGGTIGSTAIAAGNILEFTLNITTGLKAQFTIDSGQLYFHEHYFDKDAFEASLELKWIHDTALVAEYDKWAADASRLVRLEFTGDAYGTAGSGTVFSGKKGLRIDFPGSYDNISAIEFDEGRSIVTATLSGGYENTGADVLAILVANELSAVP